VKSIQLTTTQRTADWFTLRCFHCTATMASQFISESFNNKSSSERFSSLLKSWFNRSRSTANMVVGAKNEDAVLTAFSTPNYVLQVLSCGLFESKKYPWLAASPDAIAVIRAKEERHYVCVVEIKTRTTESTIAEAELLLMKYNNKTSHTTSTGDDTWNDLVPPDHSNQILLQMLVTGCNHCCYICARPGTIVKVGLFTKCLGNLLLPMLTKGLKDYWTTQQVYYNPSLPVIHGMNLNPNYHLTYLHPTLKW